MAIRPATHAGSWYTDDAQVLSQQLDGWLDAVPDKTVPIGSVSKQGGEVDIPTEGARAIIAPHAGYSYSGPAAAWAYKTVDWAKAKKVFLLGPSHHYYLKGGATTNYDFYETPLGNLKIDTQTCDEIAETWGLERMARDTDKDEHSLEMHLPYIYKMLSLHFSPAEMPPLVPIMIGNTSPKTESHYGALLAPYLSSPSNICVISSDFAHWGSRFRYTYYRPSPSSTTSPLHLKSQIPELRSHPIHASIKAVDEESMDAVESGSHEAFLNQLEETGNTVCGRHPIGVFMAAVEAAGVDGGKGRFRFVRYERSSLVERVGDSSVSYCSGFAVL
ncbi:UPF0103-domain-containing protein [Amniculicola lignicola CBS 123094]|uniref:UPF0103-domain-containing protein n=1 Tax=Amniculicola lignicola CBS 123094 TaxID=1392246 RepID=A0A6A5WF70_9PLEO|nr:UPF0103-domain-containing protein [Amniculicola lignicola CBS 123094]